MSEQNADLRLPADGERLRCDGCGNPTRFAVARSRRSVEYWHYDLAGEYVLEETDIRNEVVESISCRWCGRGDAIELIDRASIDAGTDSVNG